MGKRGPKPFNQNPMTQDDYLILRLASPVTEAEKQVSQILAGMQGYEDGKPATVRRMQFLGMLYQLWLEHQLIRK